MRTYWGSKEDNHVTDREYLGREVNEKDYNAVYTRTYCTGIHNLECLMINVQ